MNRLIEIRFAGLLLAILVFAVFIASVGKMGLRLRKGDPSIGKKGAVISRLYLTAGEEEPNGKPLFIFRRAAGSDIFVPEGAGVEPVPVDGGTGQLEVGTRTMLAVGRYVYRFELRAMAGGFLIRAEMVGALLRAGEEIGRNPSFYTRQILAWERSVNVPFVKLASSRQLDFWMDGMPLRAFRLRRLSDCGSTAPVCLEWLGPNSHATIERRDESVRHLRAGESVGLGRDDLLWIGHVPYRIIPPGTGDGDFEIRADLISQQDRRGNRGGLGSFGFQSEAAVAAEDIIEIQPLSDRYKTGHLSDRRWEPETEDELQLLVDHGLLCLTLEDQNGTPIPKLVWGRNDGRACPDALNLGIGSAPPGLPKAALPYLHRARSRQQLLDRTNASLRFYAESMPDDFPFVFEWWPVQTNEGLLRVPIRLWGVRTGTTNRQLDPLPAERTGTFAPSARPVVLRRRGGEEVVLAETRAGGRTYTQDLLGLGPLLGVRDRVEGLDNLLKNLPEQTPGEVFELTVDPDLQASLWNVFRGLTGPDPDAPRARETGISAVVMNAANGELLSIVNFPEGIEWETGDGRRRLLQRGRWGALAPAMNRAMLRGDKVGSALKVLTLYAMADAGVFDVRSGSVTRFCNASAFGLLITDGSGRVHPSGEPFSDAQSGPLPIGRGGLNAGVVRATATSCNTYFAFAATAMLSGHPPVMEWRDRCPINSSGVRIDNASDNWIICHLGTPDLRSRWEPKETRPTNWLLLPRATLGGILAEGSRIPTHSSAPHPPGFFARVLDAGYWLGAMTRVRGGPQGNLEPSLPAGRYMTSYDNLTYWRDWFAELPDADVQLFRYPMMYSPATYFGGAADHFDSPLPAGNAYIENWRSFAAQAVGEAGQASSLSLAVLYSAAARDDGHAIAPRILRAPQQPAPSTRLMYSHSIERQARLREALAAPLQPGGTAYGIQRLLGPLYGIEILGKTGTFQMETFVPTRGNSSLAECGVARWSASAGLRVTQGSASLGSSYCESASGTVTSIHRYSDGPRPGPPAGAGRNQRQQVGEVSHRTFAGVLVPPIDSAAPPVVAVVIFDLADSNDQVRRQILPQFLDRIAAWMAGFGNR